MPLAEQIPQYTIMSLAALTYRHATPLGSVFTMSIDKSSRKVEIISLPVLSHHRTYRSVYGGSLSFDSNLLVLVGEKCESCLT